MKKIVFFALALLVLVGAGVGGYIMFGKKKGEEEHAKEEEKKKPVGPPAFVQVGPLILPIVGETRIEQTVIVVVSVELADDPTKEAVRIYVPRLADAYLRALYGSVGRSDIIEGQLVSIPAVKAKLTAATHAVLDPIVGKEMVNDVHIQNVTQRPAF